MTELITRVAATIQARSIVRLGMALASDVCMDFAQAAVTAQCEFYEKALGPEGIKEARHLLRGVHYVYGDGIHGTDEICGEIQEGV
jgi:hypothetical protein